MASLADQFSLKAKDILGRKHVKSIINKLTAVAYDMVSIYASTKDYHDVTGNLLNSFAVGVYHRGKLVNVVDAGDVGREPPTRPSLAEGESYDLPVYYSEEPSRKMLPFGEESRSYTGEYGSGGKNGVNVARRSLSQRHPSGTYALIAVVAMEYAKFVQNKRNHDVITSLRYELPGIFEGRIVTI